MALAAIWCNFKIVMSQIAIMSRMTILAVDRQTIFTVINSDGDLRASAAVTCGAATEMSDQNGIQGCGRMAGGTIGCRTKIIVVCHAIMHAVTVFTIDTHSCPALGYGRNYI